MVIDDCVSVAWSEVIEVRCLGFDCALATAAAATAFGYSINAVIDSALAYRVVAAFEPCRQNYWSMSMISALSKAVGGVWDTIVVFVELTCKKSPISAN